MHRFIAVVAVLGAASLAALVAACDLGAVAPAGGFQDGGSSASGDGGGSDPGSNVCANAATPNVAGNHNQGMACITTGCHLPGDTTGEQAGAPAFIIGGTLYTDATGASPAIGATMYITEGGTTHKLITAGDGSGAGNFYVMMTTGGSTTIMGPGSAAATLCPSLQNMTMQLVTPTAAATANDGNCNRAGCHSGTQGQDGAQGPIHL